MIQINKNSFYDDDDDSYDEDQSCCQKNLIKIILIICLTIIAIACSVTLAFVYMKQIERERTLAQKKSTWTHRLEECAPILKIVGPIIKIIIKVAFSIILL